MWFLIKVKYTTFKGQFSDRMERKRSIINQTMCTIEKMNWISAYSINHRNGNRFSTLLTTELSRIYNRSSSKKLSANKNINKFPLSLFSVKTHQTQTKTNMSSAEYYPFKVSYIYIYVYIRNSVGGVKRISGILNDLYWIALCLCI